MTLVNNSGAATSNGAVETAKSLRKLYFVRAGFSVLWFVLVTAFSKTNASLASILLIIYPAWDAIAIYFDIKANPGIASKSPQYVNAAISCLTTIGVFIALKSGVPEALVVFGAWAIIAGLLQLVLGLKRKKTLGGQWPMIISGGQSMIAGTAFIILSHSPNMGIASLAGYAAFGGFYFLLSAIRLSKVVNTAKVNA